MPSLDDQPLDPAATDQLAAALGPPPVDGALAGAPPPGDPMSWWPPPHWAAPDIAPPMPDAPAPADALPTGMPPAASEPAPVPPPVDTEPAPMPDAVSGAGGTAPGEVGSVTLTPSQREAVVAQHYGENPDQLLAKLVGGSVDADTQQYLNRLAGRDPQGFAELNLRLGDAKVKQAAAEHARIADEDWKQQQANIAMRNKAIADAQAKSAQIEAEATRLASTKIGPHLSTFQKIAGMVMGFVGGLYQGRTGGQRNIGTDALNDIINRDIESQKADMANQRELLGLKRSALGELYARSGDMYVASETMRIAALKHADDVLATQQQNFAPDGTRGLQIAQLRASIGAQQNQAMQAVGQKSFENSLKLQDAARQQQIADETARHQHADEAIAMAKERRESAGSQTYTPTQLAAINAQGDKPAPVPPIPMSQKDYKQWVETQSENQKLGAATGKNELERSIGTADGLITTKGGKVWIPTGTEQDITALHKKFSASAKLIGTLDAIRREGPEWLSDVKNSDKLQRLKQLTAQARLEAISANDLGVPTGHDIELAEGAMGTNDATKVRSSLAGINQARESILRSLNVDLGRAGLDKPWSPADLGNKGAAKQPDDDVIKPLFLNPGAGDREEFANEIGPTVKAARGVTRSNAVGMAVEAYREQNGDILPSQRDQITQLTNDAASPDPKISGPAVERLQAVAERGGSSAIRHFAQLGLTTAIGVTGMKAADKADGGAR